MANTDIQPPISLYAVLSYIGKYVSKPEKSSLLYTELQSQVLPYINNLASLLSFSAQEVSHLLLQIPPEEAQNNLIVLKSGNISARRSKIRPRAASRVINYYPRYLDDPKSPGYSDYCCVKLMLHYLFTDWPDLLSVENKAYISYIEAFRAYKRLHTHTEDFYNKPERDGSDLGLELGDEEPQEAEDESPLANFEAFARRRPEVDLITRVDMLNSLGSREIDRLYNWSTYKQIKAENPIELRIKVDSSPEALNTERRKLYNTIITQYINEINLRRRPPPQLLLNVDREARTGKTFTLLKAYARVQEIATAAGKSNPVLRAAPTDITAFNIINKTLYNLLRLPVKTRKTDLSPVTLQSL
ncbi:ATP-dependent DNA helicase PIF1 [Hyaloscypha sp. PMI_1271]|nr:ATP-dependent DNA helicase PIF1 [Hyaloscypha sp. PMI_1271]